ncbi:MAG: NAD-dependent epimerase/dehydratase family protein, partial [Myxococcaceae bacterium]|nr:NAD-dependent epimerase/dehydratase family protein [Myxococcaceae bacterium]
MRIVITGGAGFVGSSLCLGFKADGHEVHAFDNLKRRGSELNLERFAKAGVKFVHGDVREPADLAALPATFDLLIDASAEPSVLAGLDGSPAYLLDTNLKGTLHCLELARARTKTVVFLSTSRVYSIAPLRALALDEGPTRFTARERPGIDEAFPTSSPRSLYGATKLASELFVQEYAATYGLKTVIDRCGVIAGAGQFGKVDQGFVALWAASHVYGSPLEYRGFGGNGKQVRDVLHPADLKRAIDLQLA